MGNFLYYRICFFIHEVGVLNNAASYDNNSKKTKKSSDEGVFKKRYDLMSDDEKSMVKSVMFHLFYMIWIIIGSLFTSQWVIFISLLGVGVILSTIKKRFYEHSTNSRLALHRVNQLLEKT